jgi:hypothetical protein
VTLDGSDSFDLDGDMITYDWRLEWSLEATPEGSTLTDVDIAQRTSPNPSFTPDVDGVYIFRLIVTDGQEDSAPDFVEIVATTPNTPPNANAGKDQTALVGAVVRCSGSGSNDPDNAPEPLTFAWFFVTVPAGSGFQPGTQLGAEQDSTSFVPDVPGPYVLRLRVSDGADSDDDEVVITAHVPNVPPNARAGLDQTVQRGEEVQLDGTASHDPDHGPAALTFTWRFVSVAAGSALTNASIADAQTAAPHFTPDVAGSYVLELRVFDGAEQAFDNVLITVPALSFQEATALVQVTVSNERSTLDRLTRQLISTADVTITNISATLIAAPLHAVFIPSATPVSMPDASGINDQGYFFYDLEAKAGIQALPPGATVLFPSKFVRPVHVRFLFTIEVFGLIP